MTTKQARIFAAAWIATLFCVGTATAAEPAAAKAKAEKPALVVDYRFDEGAGARAANAAGADCAAAFAKAPQWFAVDGRKAVTVAKGGAAIADAAKLGAVQSITIAAWVKGRPKGVLVFIRERSQELGPAREGIWIRIDEPALEAKPITVDLRDKILRQALDEVCRLGGLALTLAPPNAVELKAAGK